MRRRHWRHREGMEMRSSPRATALFEQHDQNGPTRGDDHLAAQAFTLTRHPPPIYASVVATVGEDLALIWSCRRIAE